jgi:hypothetical protein
MRNLQTWSTICLAPLLLRLSLSHPVQQPLLPSPHTSDPIANYASFELRRYGISNREDFVHMANLINVSTCKRGTSSGGH